MLLVFMVVLMMFVWQDSGTGVVCPYVLDKCWTSVGRPTLVVLGVRMLALAVLVLVG